MVMSVIITAVLIKIKSRTWFSLIFRLFTALLNLINIFAGAYYNFVVKSKVSAILLRFTKLNIKAYLLKVIKFKVSAILLKFVKLIVKAFLYKVIASFFLIVINTSYTTLNVITKVTGVKLIFIYLIIIGISTAVNIYIGLLSIYIKTYITAKLVKV